MQEFFFTILIIWLLFRILGRSGGNTFTFQTHTHFNKPPETNKEGEVKVDYIPKEGQKKKDKEIDGDYIDYEEIK